LIVYFLQFIVFLEQFIVMNSHKTLQYSHLRPAHNKEKKTTHNERDDKKENE